MGQFNRSVDEFLAEVDLLQNCIQCLLLKLGHKQTKGDK